MLAALNFAKLFLPTSFRPRPGVSTHITGVLVHGPGFDPNIGITSAGVLFLLAQRRWRPISSRILSTSSAASSVLAPSFRDSGASSAFGALAALAVLLAFGIIACELLVSVVQILFVATIGSVQIGWAAAPGTQHFAAEYWSSVLRAFFRVIITYAVASFLSAVASKASPYRPTLRTRRHVRYRRLRVNVRDRGHVPGDQGPAPGVRSVQWPPRAYHRRRGRSCVVDCLADRKQRAARRGSPTSERIGFDESALATDQGTRPQPHGRLRPPARRVLRASVRR